MDWVMIAAAKSVFATRDEHGDCVKAFNSELYDKEGITIFLPRKEWEISGNGI